MKKRSVGVTVVGSFFLIWGALGIWRVASFGPAIASTFAREGIRALRDEVFFTMILGYGMIIVYLVSGIGMLMLKNWARELFLVASVVYVVSYVAGLFRPGGESFVGLLVNVIWYGLIAWFLLRPSVKTQFQGSRS